MDVAFGRMPMLNRFRGRSITCFRGERFVFEALDFAVETGGALILKGANGTGKSSLIRIMAGLLDPFGGALDWNGEPVAGAREDHAARLHYVGFQDAIKPVLTVRENLAFWAGLRGSDGGTGPALETVGLGHLADTPAQFLSSGQRRRLSLSRLLASPADLWLLDEPTVGLDTNGIAMLEALIAAHRDGGGMVILATHQPMQTGGPPETLEIADFLATRQMFDEFGEDA